MSVNDPLCNQASGFQFFVVGSSVCHSFLFLRGFLSCLSSLNVYTFATKPNLLTYHVQGRLRAAKKKCPIRSEATDYSRTTSEHFQFQIIWKKNKEKRVNLNSHTF